MSTPANSSWFNLMKYTVTLRYQFPNWDETKGLRYTIEADSKSSAIRYARRRATDDGNAGPGLHHGRQTWSAVPFDDYYPH